MTCDPAAVAAARPTVRRGIVLAPAEAAAVRAAAASWGITMTAWMRDAIRKELDEQGFQPAGGWGQ